MVRVVRTSDVGIIVDPTGKRAGRGAYICADPSCWEAALKGRLEHALKATLTAGEREALRMYAAGIAKNSDAPAESDV